MSTGAAGWVHPCSLLLWTALALLIAWMYLQSHRNWTGARLSMTHDLIERMVGHRTRLAQEPAGSWHAGEDQELVRYLEMWAVGVGGMVLRTADGGETWTTPTESSLQQDVRASALER